MELLKDILQYAKEEPAEFITHIAGFLDALIKVAFIFAAFHFIIKFW